MTNILESETLPPAGFGRVQHVRTRIVAVDDDKVPPGAVVTTEPVRDWRIEPEAEAKI